MIAPPQALATPMAPNILITPNFLPENVPLEFNMSSSTFIEIIGAIIPRITKEEKTAIAAALPK